mmetsp:Transcript_27007/g.61396  ORF Transcript_27007/g.61396 Transcript_27007/m.61396 type:complete len:95 (-) Transcript_27007:73-357(-)
MRALTWTSLTTTTRSQAWSWQRHRRLSRQLLLTNFAAGTVDAGPAVALPRLATEDGAKYATTWTGRPLRGRSFHRACAAGKGKVVGRSMVREHD